MGIDLVEGEIIAGKYRVERTLGRGGMGVVVAAQHLLMPQPVAIKFLTSDGDPELIERFLREARATVRLKGEHVVRVLDVGQTEARLPYIVMERLEGEDLAAVMRGRERLTVPEALDYVLQTCVAMAEAHAAGIVHRDLKPANLFLTTTPDGTKLVKVLDFGIAKEAQSGSENGGGSLTRTQEMLGSPIYMAPEQMRSSRSADARSDIWSLGAILYRFLVGEPPFNAETLTELVLKVTSPAPPPSLRDRCPELDPELDRIVLRCLEKDPARRPANVAELALALAPFAPPRAAECAERAARILGVWPDTGPRGALPSSDGQGAHRPARISTTVKAFEAAPSSTSSTPFSLRAPAAVVVALLVAALGVAGAIGIARRSAIDAAASGLAGDAPPRAAPPTSVTPIEPPARGVSAELSPTVGPALLEHPTITPAEAPSAHPPSPPASRLQKTGAPIPSARAQVRTPARTPPAEDANPFKIDLK